MVSKFNSRGQVSIEFLLSLIVIVFIFSFGVFLYQNRLDYNYQTNLRISADEVADKFARNINDAFLMDNNSSLSTNISWEKNSKSISFVNKIIVVNYDNGFSDRRVFPPVEWNISDVNGTIFFKKINDVVRVTYE